MHEARNVRNNTGTVVQQAALRNMNPNGNSGPFLTIPSYLNVGYHAQTTHTQATQSNQQLVNGICRSTIVSSNCHSDTNDHSINSSNLNCIITQTRNNNNNSNNLNNVSNVNIISQSHAALSNVMVGRYGSNDKSKSNNKSHKGFEPSDPKNDNSYKIYYKHGLNSDQSRYISLSCNTNVYSIEWNHNDSIASNNSSSITQNNVNNVMNCSQNDILLSQILSTREFILSHRKLLSCMFENKATKLLCNLNGVSKVFLIRLDC